MSKLISESVKIDIALTSASAGTSAVVGPYYKMDNHMKALFIVEIGALAAGKTSALQVMQAKNAAGLSAKPVANNAATITANTNVSSATITAATVLAEDKITINGLVFEAAAAADLPNRKFKVGAGGTADTDTATSLATAINHAVAGIPGITATSSSAVVTLVATEKGEKTITIEDAAATLNPATVSALAYVECDVHYLDYKNGFEYAALKVTNSAAAQTGAIILRGHGRFSPVQKVAAAKTNVVE